MIEYEVLLKELEEQTSVKAKEIVPKLCSCLKIEDPTLSNEEIRSRVKKDVIALGFRSDYVSRIIPKEYKDPIKVESGRKGAQITNVLLKQGEYVTENAAALKAANSDAKLIDEKHPVEAEDILTFIKVGLSLYQKLKEAVFNAIHDGSPFIIIEYEGDQAKDVILPR